jgi:hypothetical protein
MVLRSVVLAVLLLAAQSGITATPKEAPKSATSGELAIITQAFSEKLKDPFSMRLKDVRIAGVSVCGEVNAKNSYGAYSGYTKFYGVYLDGGAGGKSAAMILHIDAGSDDTVATQMCTRDGM